MPIIGHIGAFDPDVETFRFYESRIKQSFALTSFPMDVSEPRSSHRLEQRATKLQNLSTRVHRHSTPCLRLSNSTSQHNRSTLSTRALSAPTRLAKHGRQTAKTNTPLQARLPLWVRAPAGYLQISHFHVSILQKG